MANPMRGEARFEAHGEAFTVTFSFNELVSLEDELNLKVNDLGAAIADSAKTVRTVFRICLESKHGTMTDAEAGDLISEIGPQLAAELLGKAFSAAFPDAVTPDPRKPVSAPAKKKAPGTGATA